MILKRDRAATHKKIKAVKQLVLINKFYDQCTNIYNPNRVTNRVTKYSPIM